MNRNTMFVGVLNRYLEDDARNNLMVMYLVLMVLFISGCGSINMKEKIEMDCLNFRSKWHYDSCKKLESLEALPDYNIQELK